jgi:hypothetical protein
MVMQQAYEQYFRSRHYDERYPRPNSSTLARVQSVAHPGTTLIDVGAGNGRYAIPLAQRGYRVIAVERSDEAREQLASATRMLDLHNSITCYRHLADVDDELIGTCRLALLLFGVLAHMRFEERQATLGRLARTMQYPAQVIGSVPNRLRRFRNEQSTTRIDDSGRAPRFTYSRTFGGKDNTFEYTAFSPLELASELALHGWKCVQIRAESFLSESTVTKSQVVGRVDSWVCRVLPPHLGYGIFFHAELARCPDGFVKAPGLELNASANGR